MTMVYQIQALGRYGDWDSEYVDPEPYATDFNTLEEAEEELENLVTIQGRNRNELRIVAMKKEGD